MDKIKVKNRIYADGNFRILELDYGKKLYQANGLDRTKLEMVSFDVWNGRFLGWLDIFVGRNGDGGWHFFECVQDNPNQVQVFYAPKKMDAGDRQGIFKKVCEYAKICHDWSYDENEHNWKKPNVPVVQRVEEQLAIRV